MNDDLQKTINKYSHEFDEIVEKINSYQKIIGNSHEIEKDQLYEITRECVNAFARMLEICLIYGKFKDNWEYDKFHVHIYGPELFIDSQKTNCNYRIGLDKDGIYLSTNLRYNKNLRYMDDDYWRSILELANFEGFKYEEIEYTGDLQCKKYPQLFKTNKSIIYRVMRKYFFDQTDESYNSSSSLHDVGEFSIILDGSYDFEFIVKQFCLGFKIMYQLNYKLWKISSL